mgnify:CR=1 FL=1
MHASCKSWGTLASETSVVILARLDDMLHGIRLRAAERRERDERARAGEALAAFLERDARPGVGQLPETVRRLRGSIDALDEAIAHSLETDRADYATVSGSVRPLVILRGMCSRAILRNQRHRCNSDLRPFYEELVRLPANDLRGWWRTSLEPRRYSPRQYPLPGNADLLMRRSC